MPVTFLKLIKNIISDVRFTLKDGNTQLSPILTNNGVIQGDTLSPLLFNLFVSDLPAYLNHEGASLGEKCYKYLQYADDLAIFGHSASDLQKGLEGLERFCVGNLLQVNTSKTKVLIFYMGGLPNADKSYEFKLNGEVLEKVNRFKYLGVTLSTQLSFSAHIREVSLRARSRLVVLNNQIGFKTMDLNLALKLFGIYILPIIEYASPVWIKGQRKECAVKFLNATFTKFLKRYLGIPFRSDNDITHHICETKPLLEIIKERSFENSKSIIQPPSVTPIIFESPTLTPYEAFKKVPSAFWRSRQLFNVPQNQYFRRKILRSIFDSTHYLTCTNPKYHLLAEDSCLCKMCGKPNHFYHSDYFCES